MFFTEKSVAAAWMFRLFHHLHISHTPTSIFGGASDICKEMKTKEASYILEHFEKPMKNHEFQKCEAYYKKQLYVIHLAIGHLARDFQKGTGSPDMQKIGSMICALHDIEEHLKRTVNCLRECPHFYNELLESSKKDADWENSKETHHLQELFRTSFEKVLGNLRHLWEEEQDQGFMGTIAEGIDYLKKDIEYFTKIEKELIEIEKDLEKIV